MECIESPMGLRGIPCHCVMTGRLSAVCLIGWSCWAILWNQFIGASDGREKDNRHPLSAKFIRIGLGLLGRRMFLGRVVRCRSIRPGCMPRRLMQPGPML